MSEKAIDYQPLIDDQTEENLINTQKGLNFSLFSKRTKFFWIFNILSLICDFSLLIVIIVNCSIISLKISSASTESIISSYRVSRIGSFLLCCMSNHVAGTFAFYYVYQTLKSFPSEYLKDIISQECYWLQVAESLLIFSSTHLKFIAKHYVSRGDGQITFEIMDEKLKANQNKTKFLTSFLMVVTNIISALGQSLLIYLTFTMKQVINRWWLYFGTPMLCITLFICNYLFSKFALQKPKDLLNVVSLKLMTKFVFSNILLFILLGFVLAGLADLVVFVFGITQKWIDTLDQQELEINLPSFSQQVAFGFIGVFMCFGINVMGSFAIFLQTERCNFIQLSFQLKNENQSISKLKLYVEIFKGFTSSHAKMLIGNLLVFGVTINSYVSKYMTIFAAVMSGSITTDVVWRNVLYYGSAVLCVCGVILYIYLIVRQSKKTSGPLGFFNFLLGFIAIPSITQVSLFRRVITTVLPCVFQSVVDNFLTNGIVPATAIISFLQAMPLMFKIYCVPLSRDEVPARINQIVGNVEDEQRTMQAYQERMRQQELNDVAEQQPQQNFNKEQLVAKLQSNLKPLDLNFVYKASKFSRAAFDKHIVNIATQVVDNQELIKKLKKKATIVERKDDQIFVAVRGTRSACQLKGAEMLMGFCDWAVNAFGSLIPIQVTNDQQTWCHFIMFKKARKIFQLLEDAKLADSGQEVVFTGHHSGGLISMLLALMYHREHPDAPFSYVAFGVPLLVGPQLPIYLRQKAKHFKIYQLGKDGKLFLSAVVSNELRWSNSFCETLPACDAMSHIMGYFSVMNTGDSMNNILHTCKVLMNRQIMMAQHKNAEEKDKAD